MHTGSLAFETASFTFALTSLCTGAEGAGLFLRDEVVGGLSRRDASERVLAGCSVWDQNYGDSEARCE